MGRRRRVVDPNALEPDQSTLALLRRQIEPNVKANVNLSLPVLNPSISSSRLGLR
jgi:hypothetical protein